MTETNVDVPISALSRKALARETLAAITRLEHRMSELDDAVASLTQAVTDIAGRILPRIDALEQQLAAAQQGEADALADAAENVAAIRTDVDSLNQIAVDAPAPPAEPPA